MRSIRTKITALTLLAVLCSVLLSGGICINAIREEGDEDAEQEMNALCDNRRMMMNEYLGSVEQSVDMISRYAAEFIDEAELEAGSVVGFTGDGSAMGEREWKTDRQRALDEYLEFHTGIIDGLFKSVAANTDGVVAYYYKLNPEFSARQQGVFYSRTDDGSFVSTEMTDVFYYPREDVNHVGWYYQTLDRGEPSWLEVYDNDNLGGIRMLSYTVPVYKADTFCGIVGMDISLEALVDLVKDIQVFKTGFAYLSDVRGRIVYHPEVASGNSLEDISPELVEVAEQMRYEDSSDGLVPYTYGGVEKRLVYSTLSNGMKLVIVAPEAEINERWTGLVRRVTAIGLIVMAIFAVAVTVMMNRITVPLKRLTKAASHMLDGNYDVELKHGGRDELGILTDTFRHLTDHLRVYISDLNSKAYKDALTGIRNRGAFEIVTRQLDDMIATAPGDNPPRFGFIMLDCNELKSINDRFGHDRGDLYLQTACGRICAVFQHCPVFRLGGDEFGVILQGSDYDNRDELLDAFDESCKKINAETLELWKHVDIAKGVATYDPALDRNTESVLRRADEAMYEDKKAKKAEKMSA